MSPTDGKPGLRLVPTQLPDGPAGLKVLRWPGLDHGLARIASTSCASKHSGHAGPHGFCADCLADARTAYARAVDILADRDALLHAVTVPVRKQSGRRRAAGPVKRATVRQLLHMITRRSNRTAR